MHLSPHRTEFGSFRPERQARFPQTIARLASVALLSCGLGWAQGVKPALQDTVRTPDNPLPAASTFGTVALTSSMDVLNDSVKLGKGDMVSFRVVEDRRDPLGLIVTDSGEMEVPFIGRVSAAGKTCKQLAYEIKPLLEKRYFYQATVIIGLNAIGTKSLGKIYLTGELKQQGAQELMPEEALTVSKAIIRAGGLADFANKKKVKLIRKKPGGGTVTTVVNMVDIIEKGHFEKDPVLQPGDMIVVPERLINF